MRKALPLLAAICIALHSFAQYPTAFAWPAAPGKDQKEQGTCHIFAAVAAVETWYDILYGNVPAYGISQEHPYSLCGNANPFPSTTIQDALNFFLTTGVVDLNQLPYAPNTACTVGDPGGTAYFALALKSGNSSSLVNGDCGTPRQGCATTGATPASRYRIANFSLLNIGQYTSNDQLKHAIMNYGPIPLWMYVTALHPNPHAYCLYGWDASGNWLMTDSWPTLPNNGVMKTNLDIIGQFRNNYTFTAFILQNSASYPAVYRQTYNGSSWSDDPNTTNATTGCINAVSNAFTISGPTTITTAGASFSVTNLGLLDNPTVTWSMESVAYNASVGFSPTTGATTTVTPGMTGTVNIVASIRRPNGLCEKIRLNNVAVHGTNIPFTLTQTQNLCSGTTRSIQYVASSSYPLTCNWTLHPPVGGNVYTIINGCTFTMDFPTPPSSYGITMTVTSSALPGALDGATTGGPAMSCTTGHSAPRDSLSGNGETLDPAQGAATGITLFPNPATGWLTLQLPPDRSYQVRLVNVLGTVVHARQAARSSVLIDVSRFARGVYFVQLVDMATGATMVKKIQLE